MGGRDRAKRYAIVGIDPLSSVASALGLNFDKSNEEYVAYHDRLIKPLVARGVIVVSIDNIGHAFDARARAKGVSAKQDKADIIISCKLRTRPAALALTCQKARSVRSPFRRGDAWTFDRDTLHVERDTDEQGDETTFRPTELMERVSRALEADPDSAATASARP